MNMAEAIAKLNRRNKAGLCATVTCVGLILLVSHVGFRAVLGIILLGAAFSWAIGSNSRPVHWSFVAFGLLLLLPAVAAGFLWPQHKPEEIKNETLIVEAGRDRMKNDTSLTTADIDEIAKDELELARLRADSTLVHVVRELWGFIAGGLLLLTSGIGLLVGVKPVHLVQSDGPR